MAACFWQRTSAIALLVTLFVTTSAVAQTGNPDAARLKQIQRAQFVLRAGGRPQDGPGGRRSRNLPARNEGDPYVPATAQERAGLAPPFSTQALGTNVRANNRATDIWTCPPSGTPCSTQSEESLAAWHQYVLIAWNDGEKADPITYPPPSNDVQGYGFSTNGGASFTDGGVPPKGANWTWVSDPVVTVNEKTGTFYYCALADSTPNFSGIGIVSATFSGSSIVWGTPIMIRKVSPTSLILLDKPWVVADSSSGNLYASYTTFTAFGSDHIQFQRSTNGIAWTPAVTLSAAADSGFVQGSRPAVGPNGEVYVTWAAIGPLDVDFFRIRKSTNAGVTFGSQVTYPTGGTPALGYYANFGSGAPGYNRERGVTFPSIAVDRSAGPNRGRVYATWNECVNFYDDLGGGSGARSEPAGEAGANDTPATATPFTAGNTLRGTLGSATDFDYWSFSALQGQTGVFYMDSLNVSLDVSFRLLCSDGTTRLGFSNFGAGGGGLIVFTFPTTGTYYLRCTVFSANTGGYRIRTKFSAPGPERARDHRDVFVTSSANGTTWTVPTRVNDDPGWFDNWLPEVGVSGQGLPYVMWYDWRDSPTSRCGGISQVYLALSQNGGSSWSSLGAATDAASDWTNSTSYLAPNQGDYLGLYVNDLKAYLAWADVRNGDPDVYTLSVLLQTTPVLASLVSVEPSRDRVRLTWYAPGAEALPASVYRRTESTDWAAIGRAEVPASGQIVFTDAHVAPGARYQYRIGISESGAESFFGETWVTVPVYALAIASVAPNPAVRELWVSFTLPTATPATLRLIDVAGREVRSRDVGAATGPQRVDLADGGALPMGVYAVRLTQGGRSVSTRVSVVR